MKNIFLVDMDDTLLDFPRTERENLKKTLAQFGITADDALASRFHEINDALWKALERGEISRERLKERRFELLFEEYGFAKKIDIPAVARAFWRNFPNVCFPFEGALEFLEELKARGRVYIVTNGGTVIQKTHIADAGFLPFLDGVFISEEIGFNKPSLEYANYVESHIAGYERSRAVWIGDSPTSDGQCAMNRGIDFILFSPHGRREHAGMQATSYRKVLELLDL